MYLEWGATELYDAALSRSRQRHAEPPTPLYYIRPAGSALGLTRTSPVHTTRPTR